MKILDANYNLIEEKEEILNEQFEELIVIKKALVTALLLIDKNPNKAKDLMKYVIENLDNFEI